MPFSTSDAPGLLDKRTRVYIKDGKRKMLSDGGYMYMDRSRARKIFGRLKGGKYSLPYA
jgi:hypothetical protein